MNEKASQRLRKDICICITKKHSEHIKNSYKSIKKSDNLIKKKKAKI